MKNNNKWYKDNVSSKLKYNESQEKRQDKYNKVNEYMIYQKINVSVVFIIVLIFLVFLIFFNKPSSIDILEDVKRTYIYGMIIVLGLIAIAIILFNFIVKEKKILSNLLKIILFFNIIFLIIFLCIESNLNRTYNNEEKFGEIYDTKIENKSDKKYVDIWKSILSIELKTKTERQVFIDENMSQFTYFRIKAYLIFILYVITMISNTYVIAKIDKNIKGQEILNKNDKILFKNEN